MFKLAFKFVSTTLKSHFNVLFTALDPVKEVNSNFDHRLTQAIGPTSAIHSRRYTFNVHYLFPTLIVAYVAADCFALLWAERFR